MLTAITTRLASLRSHLTRLDSQPLGKAALTIVLLLDIFILSSIFDGLSTHTAQLTQPDEYIPANCREIVLNESWNPSNRLERLSAIAASERNSPYYPPADRSQPRHPVCDPVLTALEAVKKDPTLGRTFTSIRKIRQERSDLRLQTGQLKGSYDTALLETIARQRDGQVSVDALQRELRSKTETLNTLSQKLAELEAGAERDERVQRLWVQLERISESERHQLREELRRLNFWYPVKRLGMELLFLLPLISAFYLWNAVSLRKDRPVQTLVSSHLLVIAVIPVLFKLIQLVYDILPKKFLQNLIALLESLNLIALWHYLAMALAIAATLALIYIVQKKIFSPEKLRAKRIARGLCQQCGTHLPAASPACPFCGFNQYKPCRHCGKPTHVHGSYCKECGKALG